MEPKGWLRIVENGNVVLLNLDNIVTITVSGQGQVLMRTVGMSPNDNPIQISISATSLYKALGLGY